MRKLKKRPKKQIERFHAPDNTLVTAIETLGRSASQAFSEVISQAVAEFASDDSIAVEERRAALTEIGNTAFANVSELDFQPPKVGRRPWAARDRSLGDTPFDHARREFPEFIRPGLLKIHFEPIDPQLYEAMRAKHWIEKEIAKNGRQYLDKFFLTKKEVNRRGIATLPPGYTAAKLRESLPKVLQQRLALLDVLRKQRRGPR